MTNPHCTTASNNTGTITTDPSFVGPLTDYAGFAVAGGSYAKGGGVASPVYSDIAGLPRSATVPTIGAHE